MNTNTSERPVTLQNSSWDLLDAATALDPNLTAGVLLDALVQDLLHEDQGAAVERSIALRELRKLFGKNRG